MANRLLASAGVLALMIVGISLVGQAATAQHPRQERDALLEPTAGRRRGHPGAIRTCKAFTRATKCTACLLNGQPKEQEVH